MSHAFQATDVLCQKANIAVFADELDDHIDNSDFASRDDTCEANH
jgi:hypothetical protein